MGVLFSAIVPLQVCVLKCEIKFETGPIKPGLTIYFHLETLKHTLLPLFHVFQRDMSPILPPPIQPTFPCPTHTIRPIHDTTTARKWHQATWSRRSRFPRIQPPHYFLLRQFNQYPSCAPPRNLGHLKRSQYTSPSKAL